MSIVRISIAKAKELRGISEWDKLKKMSDAEIRAAVQTDATTRELKLEDLPKFKREVRK